MRFIFAGAKLNFKDKMKREYVNLHKCNIVLGMQISIHISVVIAWLAN